MKKVFQYLRPYNKRMLIGFIIKVLGTFMDLGLPWVLAYIIDNVIPHRRVSLILWWGVVMVALSIGARTFNIVANRMASRVARDTTRSLRHDLFEKILSLSGTQLDYFTIPSLESRMTSDTYNIHNMIGMMQRIGVRAPIILTGGIVITSLMEPVLALVLLGILPLLFLVVYIVTKKGIPIYTQLQKNIDKMVQIVRENITGIRIIKALSKSDYEKERFFTANDEVVCKELKAGTTMASTNPIMNLLLNLGLTLVVVIGAFRVNGGFSQTGKIVAFLSYFAIMQQAVMAITRIFVVFSKASASAGRIAEVLNTEEDLRIWPEQSNEVNNKIYDIENERVQINKEITGIENKNIQSESTGIEYDNIQIKNKSTGIENEDIQMKDVIAEINNANIIINNETQCSNKEGTHKFTTKNSKSSNKEDEEQGVWSGIGDKNKFVEFDHVSFSYTQEPCILDIDVSIRKGESLGIIGSTGSGKTTLINLLMRFYDVTQGCIRIDEKDIKTIDKQALRQKFGVVFQNDVLFSEKISENISIGRSLSQEQIYESVEHAQAASFIDELDEALDFKLAIKGSNLSGGQKQRLLVARALAGKPEMLILDDASSALDYKTDSLLRKAIRENYQETTTIVIAQRISSVMKLDHILVMEDGQKAGYGTHEELLDTCEVYQEIYQSQLMS